jgi:hypothetical protein
MDKNKKPENGSQIEASTSNNNNINLQQTVVTSPIAATNLQSPVK